MPQREASRNCAVQGGEPADLEMPCPACSYADPAVRLGGVDRAQHLEGSRWLWRGRPRRSIPMLKERNVRTGFFEAAQFEAVRKRLSPPLQAVARFAYLTGWRVLSEVLPLQWRQVDLVGGVVRLDAGTTKNEDARTFPLTAELRAVLEAQLAYTDTIQKSRGAIIPHVFHRKGKPIKSFRKAWATACAAAGCPDRIPHDFRRSTVRNLVRAGIPERVAMTMTGHKTRSVFERYNIVSEGGLRDAARRLDAVAGA